MDKRTGDRAFREKAAARIAKRRVAEFDMDLPPDITAAILRERIYGSIACLSTLLVLSQHAVETGTAWSAVVNVVIATGGLFAASALAEFVAHLGVHGAAPKGAELVTLFRTSAQILEAAAVPLILLLVSAFGWLSLHTAVWSAIWVLVATMGLFALLAARRTPLSFWGRLLLVVALLALGAGVVLVKMLAH